MKNLLKISSLLCITFGMVTCFPEVKPQNCDCDLPKNTIKVQNGTLYQDNTGQLFISFDYTDKTDFRTFPHICTASNTLKDLLKNTMIKDGMKVKITSKVSDKCFTPEIKLNNGAGLCMTAYNEFHEVTKLEVLPLKK
jgi:hypothetical protein